MSSRNGSNNGNGVHEDTALASRNGNGHRPDAAPVSSTGQAIAGEHELLWDGLSPAVTKALAQPLDRSLVSTRQGRAGRIYEYLEGHVVIDQAGNIFGRGGWGYDIVGDVTLREIETVDSATGEVKRGQAYAAKVMVTVPGALSRTDVGFHAVAEETVDGHETAYKGAVTDALKRALRSFGDQFGNCLYGDQTVKAPPRPERVPARTNGVTGQSRAQSKGHSESQVEKLRERLMELCFKQGFDEAQVQVAVQRQTGKSLDDLTAEELEPLVEAAAKKLNRMRQDQSLPRT